MTPASRDASRGAVTGLVLAAGAGRRLGGRPKARLTTSAGVPLLRTTVEALLNAGCGDVVVVLGAAPDAAGLVDGWRGRVRTVVAPDWAEGIGASLRRGLDALTSPGESGDRVRVRPPGTRTVSPVSEPPEPPEPPADAVLVTLADLPDVGEDVMRRVIDAWKNDGARPDALARASYAGKPGHPVLLGRDHWAPLRAEVAGDVGAQPYLRGRRVRQVDCDDLATGRDLDRPEDLAGSPEELATLLAGTGYLCDEALATVGFLALQLHRPLLVEGEPGTGKTSLAEALAEGMGVPLIRLQCYEGIDAAQALYDWDFPRQILHLRAVETVARGEIDLEDVEQGLFSERFLLSRPVLRALRESPAVLLVDEVDRADDEFEAFLLEVLSTYQVSIPELGTVSAATPPVVVLTSNRTREVHDALKRRCLYHWIDHPSLERELAIVRSRAPEVSEALAAQVVALVQQLRSADLLKPPGVAETLDWARALDRIGTTALDVEAAARTLGVAVKYREDAARVRAALDRMLAG